jgi:hypothetical protein
MDGMLVGQNYSPNQCWWPLCIFSGRSGRQLKFLSNIQPNQFLLVPGKSSIATVKRRADKPQMLCPNETAFRWTLN